MFLYKLEKPLKRNVMHDTTYHWLILTCYQDIVADIKLKLIK